MNGPRLSHAIVFVSDMPRSVAFYRDVLGLPLRFESPHWTEFATEAVTLALHLAEGPGTAGDSQVGLCQVGLTVPDLDAFHVRLGEAGVRCLRPPTVEPFGAELAKYADPDGLAFSVSEAGAR
jgi:lactoylglutathione lyase